MPPSSSSSSGGVGKTQKGMLPKVGGGTAGDKRYRQVALTSYIGNDPSDHTKQFIERQFKGRILAQGKAGWENKNMYGAEN